MSKFIKSLSKVFYKSNVSFEYSGDLKNGKRDGFGTIKYLQSGDTYTGYFHDDMKHGKGKYTFANGSVYDGQFKLDRYDGEGVFTNMNGNIFTGMNASTKNHASDDKYLCYQILTIESDL